LELSLFSPGLSPHPINLFIQLSMLLLQNSKAFLFTFIPSGKLFLLMRKCNSLFLEFSFIFGELINFGLHVISKIRQLMSEVLDFMVEFDLFFLVGDFLLGELLLEVLVGFGFEVVVVLGLLEGLAQFGLELLGVLLEEEQLLLEVGGLLFGLLLVLVDE
jgi:hypothetical protein